MSSKQGQLSRSDLLSLIAKQEGELTDPEVIAYLADALGMQQQEARIRQITSRLIEDHWPDEQMISNHTSRTSMPENLQLNNPSPTAKLKAQYWQLLKQTNREDEADTDDQNQITTRPIWQNRPEARPRFPALMSEEAIQQRLLPTLRQEKATRRVDIDRLIDQVSRAEFVTKLPMQHRSRDTQALQIIDDRQVHLMPYWLDHSWLTWHVRDSMAEYRFSHAVIEQGETEPQSILHNTLEDYQAPPEGSTILLLSDLGVLTDHLHRYIDFLDQMLIQGYHLVVVTPCHLDDYPADLATKINLVSWEQDCCALPLRNDIDSSPQATPKNTDEKTDDSTPLNNDPEQSENTEKATQCPRQKWGEQLLMLCSTAIRLEPELLRAQRYALNTYRRSIGKKPLPASAESLAWQHRAVTQKHSVAATVDAEENKHWQITLKHQPIELKQAVFESQREWRGGKNGLPDEIWFEEFAGVDHCCNAAEQVNLEWFNQDFEDTKDFLNYLHQRILSGHQTSDIDVPQTKAWLHRFDSRLTKEAFSEGSLQKYLQACFLNISDEKGRTPAGNVVDPALVGKTQPEQPRQSAWLCQLGSQLAVIKHDPFNIPKNRSSLIARLDYRVCSLKVGNSSTPIELPEQLGDELTPLLGSENIGVQKARLQTDLTELELCAFKRPKWAKRVGRDAYGLFADLEIPHTNSEGKTPKIELIQRFRWIPAGTFMMGALEGEWEEHINADDCHKVTLTKGYWLADTTVTQAVWQAVMEGNFTDFKNDYVKNISWNDTQDFIQKLNQGLLASLGGLVCRLPTEAESEYAYHAGKATKLSSRNYMKVNFFNHLDANGETPEGRSANTVMKPFPNVWGLYEMHKIVEEWCADEWQRSLSTHHAIDPYFSGHSGSERVARGRSWHYDDVTDAAYPNYRRHYRPDYYREGRTGLRLSLGHDLKVRSAKQN